MGRGYWLPPGHENLPAFDGFYVDSSAVYVTKSIENDWQNFLDGCTAALTGIDRTLNKHCEWLSFGVGQRRFVLAKNDKFNYIAEEVDDYIAVYTIISEECESPGFAKRSFDRQVRQLQHVLTNLYPGHVRQRQGCWNTRLVG